MKAVFLDFDTLGPSDVNISRLTDELPGLVFFPDTDAEHLSARISGAEVVIVNKIDLDDGALRGADRLKLICLAATGTDNVALKTSAELGIGVTNIRDYCTPSVIQHVFALILALTQHQREYDKLVRSGAWAQRPEFCLLDFPIRELHGKTLGIVGLGSLGRGVAEVGRAFGMRVIAARRVNEQSKNHALAHIERVETKQLLERADVVSLHCPLNAETENLINADTLQRMRDDAILINTARGGLVDSAALVNALKKGAIGGAGIDVLRQEPPVAGDPVLDARLPNLIVTPHIAWAAREARQRAVDEIAANIASYKQGQRRNRVV